MGKGKLDLDDDAVKICGGVTCCAVLITAIVLIAVSFSSLEPNEVGLRFNSITMEISSDQLYEGGRHFLGVGESFIKFPKTVQSVKFTNETSDGPIRARTKDGLVVLLQISFNYQLRTTLVDLTELYLDYGEMGEVETLFNRIARNRVRLVAANYSSLEFVSDARANISDNMKVSLTEGLDSAYASLSTFELLAIDLPDQFENALVRYSAAIKDVDRARSDLTVAQESATTRVKRAQQEAQVFMIQAQSFAQSLVLENEAIIDTLTLQYRLDGEAYANLAQSLGFTTDDLFAYLWNAAISNARDNGAAIVVNAKSPESLDL